jgi:UDP-N-acetylmuramoylalanine--D-glutamate ligase
MARNTKVIVGLGETGLSFARYLAARGDDFLVLDDNPRALNVAALADIAAGLAVQPISDQALVSAKEIYLSPGVPLSLPVLASASARGVSIKGDVQLFGELAQAPIIAITGTNGKSTVSELVFKLFAAQQGNVALAGNIGTPCLDVLSDQAELYVLELSSYQLELATEIPANLALVLNLSPDHQDRYESLEDYYGTKLNLYRHCELAVVNRELGVMIPELSAERVASFGLGVVEEEGHFGLVDNHLTHGSTSLLATEDLALSGTHNYLNVLAALATGYLLGLNMERMLDTVRSFEGLLHRGETVAELGSIRFVNDSKATNPGAMAASVKGIARARNIHLIAGGDTKGLKFEDAVSDIGDCIKTVCLIGQSKVQLEEVFADFDADFGITSCKDMAQAVEICFSNAVAGDIVLLAPGCASFGDYENYAARGDDFKRCALDISRLEISRQDTVRPNAQELPR